MPNPIPLILRPGDTGQLDLGAQNARVVYSAAGIDEWTWQVALRPHLAWPTAGATAIVTARYSNDGINWVSDGTPKTLTAAGFLPTPGATPATIDVTAYRLVALEVTTPSTSSVMADVTGYGEPQR